MIKKTLFISFMVAAANTQAETVLYGDGQARRYQRDREISAIEAIGQAMQEQEVERNRAAENNREDAKWNSMERNVLSNQRKMEAAEARYANELQRVENEKELALYKARIAVEKQRALSDLKTKAQPINPQRPSADLGDEETHRLWAESLVRFITKYPVFRDEQGPARKAMDQFIEDYYRNPKADQSVFFSPNCPEILGEQFVAKIKSLTEISNLSVADRKTGISSP